MVYEHLFNASPEQSRRWSACRSEQLGKALLRAVGAVRRAGGWALPDGVSLRLAVPGDAATDLGCIKDLERRLRLDRQRVTITHDEDGWRADLFIPPESVPHARRYRTATFDSEARARAALLLTVAEARRGDVIGVVHGDGAEVKQRSRRRKRPAFNARKLQPQGMVP